MKCPYCKNEMIRGNMWGGKYAEISWLEKSETPELFSFNNESIPAHKCFNCEKIIIDLNETNRKYTSKKIMDPLNSNLISYTFDEVLNMLKENNITMGEKLIETELICFPETEFELEKIDDYNTVIKISNIYFIKSSCISDYYCINDAVNTLESELIVHAIKNDNIDALRYYLIYKLGKLYIDFYYYYNYDFGNFEVQTPIYYFKYDALKREFTLNQLTGLVKKTITGSDITDILPKLLKIFDN